MRALLAAAAIAAPALFLVLALGLCDRLPEARGTLRATAAHVTQTAGCAFLVAEVAPQQHRAAFVGQRVLGQRIHAPAVLRAQGLELPGQTARALFDRIGGLEDADRTVFAERDQTRFLEHGEQRRGHARP